MAPPDELATVVERHLEQRSPWKSWGLLKTLLLGVPSFGLLPLLAWPAQFREYAAEESLALQDLARWVKFRGRQPEAVGPLLAAADETACGPLPLILSLILAALVVGVFTIQFTNVEFTLERLLACTYSRHDPFSVFPWAHRRELLHRVWAVPLAIGFAVQWLHVRAHSLAVERFTGRFDEVSAAEGLPPIRFPMRGWTYFRPLWILMAVVLTRHGAWWAIPMVLAGMAQIRYTRVTSKRLRAELARRVREIVTLQQRPVPMMPVVARRCGNRLCMAPIRPQSRFCTRCGRVTTEAPT